MIRAENKDSNTYLDGGAISPPKITAYANYQASKNLRLAINYIGVQSRNRFEAINGDYSGRKAPVSSYHLFNASTSYVINDSIKLSAGIDNLSNSDYYSHIAQSHTFSGWNVKGKGRTANLGLVYSF